MFCTAGFLPCEEHPTQDVSIDIPRGILDDVPLVVMLGGIAWFSACLSLSGVEDDVDGHNEGWHWRFLHNLEDYFQTFTVYSLPKLPAQGFAFCMELSFDCPKVFGDGEPKRVLKIFAAMAIFLRHKNVLLQCCRRCQILYTSFSSDAILSTSINESSVNTNASGIPS